MESIYSQNNNYLLMDRAYKDDKTIALAKANDFYIVVPSKKNRKSPWSYNKQLYKHKILLNDISFV